MLIFLILSVLQVIAECLEIQWGRLSGRHAPDTSIFLSLGTHGRHYLSWKSTGTESSNPCNVLKKLISNSASLCTTLCLLGCSCALVTRDGTLNIVSKLELVQFLNKISLNKWLAKLDFHWFLVHWNTNGKLIINCRSNRNRSLPLTVYAVS